MHTDYSRPLHTRVEVVDALLILTIRCGLALGVQFPLLVKVVLYESLLLTDITFFLRHVRYEDSAIRRSRSNVSTTGSYPAHVWHNY